jgi:hypothetical protein
MPYRESIIGLTFFKLCSIGRQLFYQSLGCCRSYGCGRDVGIVLRTTAARLPDFCTRATYSRMEPELTRGR